MNKQELRTNKQELIPKFRAWLKNDREMIDADEIHWDRDRLDFIGDGITFMREADEIELMQSAGLKDKNGQEIFEGDVIAIEVDDTGTPINARVFQNSEIGILMFHVFEDDEDVPMVELLEDNSVAFVIIGNIYKNKDILEEKE
jgi:uncharacterized phage protein (TIGR01671 family)